MRLKTMCSNIVAIVSRRTKSIFILVAAIAVLAAFPVQFIRPVSIVDGSEHFKVYTFESDARSILASTSIEYNQNDSVQVLNTSNSSDGGITIRINRAFPVILTIGEETRTVQVTGGTVGDLLKEVGYTLDIYDEINYPTDKAVFKNMCIDVVDIDYTVTKSTKTLAHKTTTLKSTSVKAGENQIINKGSDGKALVTTTVKTINGTAVEKTVETTVEKKPVTEKVQVGIETTKANENTWMSELTPEKEIYLDSNGAPVNYKKKLTGKASAYCTGTTCSTGVGVKQGYIAVDPNIIPYGTKMYIRTTDGSIIYGYAIAADTGGFTSWGNTIADLYMYSYSDCINFGRRNIEIYIL